MASLGCIVLAAGDGTRMRSARPKVLHALCGQPIIDYAVQLATALRCRPVVAVVGAAARDVRARLPQTWRTVRQTTRRGTGHAVTLALRQLPRTVQTMLILYGDQPLLRRETIQRLVQTHRARRAACTVLTARVDDPQQYGRVVTHGDLLVKIVEDADATPEEQAIQDINVGVMLIERRPLEHALRQMTPANAQHEYYLTAAITWLAQQPAWGDVMVERTGSTDEALGINTREDLAAAARVLWRRTAADLMQRGVTIVDPQTTAIDPEVRIGTDTTILPGTVIERDVVIGRRCQIGPYAHLRRGVRLADDVRIGNFTEVVRSRVGPRVRMNHCSYLGDAHIGADVNIGAGTITANYDGVAKHHTRVGARAFVGSGTVMVAPAVIGEGATTGAGTVVTGGTRVRRGATVVGVPAREVRRRSRRRRRG